MDLEILRVKTPLEYDEQKFKNLDERLLKPPFLGVLNGSVRSGKSVLLMNLIYNSNFYKSKFDKIIFYSPTVLNDLTLRHLAEDDDIIKITDMEKIDEIFKTIVEDKMENEETKKEQWLHIFDDIIGIVKPKSYIVNFTTRFRHSKNSMIFTSQGFRSLPPLIRTNSNFYIIFRTNNMKEFSKLFDEFSSIIPNFKELYDTATDKPYNFLYLDLRKLKAYHNFTTLLWEK